MVARTRAQRAQAAEAHARSCARARAKKSANRTNAARIDIDFTAHRRAACMCESE